MTKITVDGMRYHHCKDISAKFAEHHGHIDLKAKCKAHGREYKVSGVLDTHHMERTIERILHTFLKRANSGEKSESTIKRKIENRVDTCTHIKVKISH